jgi:acyl transferase domain-containing protein/NAD(P)-dependent dehydrogenase (short-subunit alcohol dehydrogenase family)/acyl carrier protein
LALTANDEKLREYLKRVTADLRKTRQRLREVETRVSEPIAIVGMSCRYPGGVSSPEALWSLVAAGVDAFGEFPGDRGWNLEELYEYGLGYTGTGYAQEAGFLYDAADFDAAFFGISPREALAMDPQQRLLLEASWEAFEHAGLDPHTVRGSQTGVFTGLSSFNYGLDAKESAEEIEGYRMTGATCSVASGRVAYTLGLEGPAISVDTACSSSLVALHLACQALRAGECSLALAGGVTVMSDPVIFIEFARQRGLAPNGRCKSFADGADGTGWGEGVGLLLLERLSDAQRLGHEVLAVVRGSAVNQDGASNGLTAPNGLSQERVIRDALANAGLAPRQIDVVEGHGTGTRLGDPIEAQALIATYGPERQEGDPLLLGSVKSNIGHTMAAAGVAGVIKMVMALRHGALPRTLHIDRPTDEVDWSSGTVALLTGERPWERGSEPRRAGVSSFGMSGTNAHTILEEAPVRESGPADVDVESGSIAVGFGHVSDLGVVPWVVSGRSPAALRDQAERLRAFVAPAADLDVVDVGCSLASRTVFEDRAVVLGGSHEELLRGVDALAHGRSAPEVVEAAARVGGAGEVTFVFPGQGAQWAGMAVGLLDGSRVFRDRFAECERALAPFVEWSPEGVLRGDRDAPPMERVDVVQPLLFAVMVSLAELWCACGVRPDAVVGHSQGEIAAAYVAGVLSLPDAARVVTARSRALLALAGRGGMVSVAASGEEVERLVECYGGTVSIAAFNGPGSVVVSGETEALEKLLQACEAHDIRARQLAVDYAAHSRHVESLREELRAVCSSISPRSGDIPFYSSVTGQLLDGLELDASYWYRNLRDTVQFERAVGVLLEQGRQVFLEVSPHPVLLVGVQEALDALPQTPRDVVTAGSLRRGEGGPERFLRSLAEVFVSGVNVDWNAVFEGSGGSRVVLPTYAFQRERYWLDSGDRAAGDLSAARSLFHLDWVPLSVASGLAQGRWALLGANPHVSDALLHAGVDVDVYDDQTSLCEAVDGGLPTPEVVLAYCGHDGLEELGAMAAHVCVKGVLSLLQRWLADERLAASRLVLLTRGAVAVGEADDVFDLAGCAAWGLVRAAQSENPGRLMLVDVDDGESSRAALAEAIVAAASFEEPQLAIRSGRVSVPRLARVTSDRKLTMPAPSFDPSATVLITGGTGGLGGLVARHLVVEHGVRRLALTSRSGLQAPGAAELKAELEGLGAQVTVVTCDVSEREQVKALIAAVSAEHPLRAVVHAAGVLDDGVIESLTDERLDRVLAPKVDGAWHLHELTEHLDLDAFVLFSSAAGVFGNVGQGNYAAANAFLDGLAAYRHAHGLPGTSMAWGLWGQTTGLTGHLRGADLGRMGRAGIRAFSSEQGLELFDAALGLEEPLLVPAHLDIAMFRARARAGELPALLRDLVRVAARTVGPESHSLAHKLVGLSDSERERVVLDLVRAHAGEVLGHSSPESVDEQRTFKDMGFSSLAAVELRNRLAVATGLRLTTTLVFDYPTLDVLAGHLLEQLAGGSSRVVASAHGPAVYDPIVIVGMSCRFPGGASSPERLWDLLASGGDAVSSFPTDRGWDLDAIYHPDPDHHGTTYTRDGGFLDDAGDFDAAFFGIGPREALGMSPQQRLMLEACWEALEKASIDPRSLKGSQSGVFIGEALSDYGAGLSELAGKEVEGYLATGTAGSVLSGRVAYTLGLEGPAVTVDTACSSSLVAMHLASGALRGGECSLALTGGVTVMATPNVFIEFSRQAGNAPDGRCKSFADVADGAGWSEGVGMVVLERLSDARRNGHSVLAVVRGSAINQDGASNGLTAPNGPSQQRVIMQALANAGLSAGEIDAVEAHGTGTMLGDPIEAHALLATYGQERDADRPLWIGSVKSNIGHTQAAAGVAGVIKLVMAFQHDRLPRTLHIDEPSSRIDWSSGAVSLLSEEMPWPRDGRPRRAGVSSFGISGTNAHMILEEPPATGDACSQPSGALQGPSSGLPIVPWVISADSDGALREQAERLRAHVESRADASPADIGLSLCSRAELEHRAVVFGEHRRALLAGLGALAARHSVPELVEGVAGRHAGSIAFLFTGQGAQHGGMGSGLYEAFPVFSQALDEVCAPLDLHLECSMRELMFAADGSAQARKLDETAFTQAGLFALEVALFRLLESWDVRPGYVIGHSVGELAAAHVAGALSLEDACVLVAARGRLMGALPRGGAMVAVQASEEEILGSLVKFDGQAALAAVNGPAAVVVSGEESAVLELAAQWRERGRKTRRLRVSHAFHSHLMDGMLEQFAEVARGVPFTKPVIPIVSNVTGKLVSEDLCKADYWVRHARSTVRFADGVRALVAQGVHAFIELGPDGVLSAMAGECLNADEGLITPLLRAGRPDAETLLAALAQAWTHGAPVGWSTMFEASGARRVSLPTYAFQRRRYWLESGRRAGGYLLSAGQESLGHPLLSAMVRVAEDDRWLFTGRLSPQSHNWLGDHVMMGRALMPGTCLLELALCAGTRVGCPSLQELVVERPLHVPLRAGVQLQVSLGEVDEAGCRSVSIHSRLEPVAAEEGDLQADGEWTRHATGVLRPRPATKGTAPVELSLAGSWPPEGAEPLNIEDLYERLSEHGYAYGPTFQNVRAAWRRGEELYGEVALAPEQRDQTGFSGLHPALFDAATHLVGADPARVATDGSGDVWLPFSWHGVDVHAQDTAELRVRIVQTTQDSVGLTIADEHGSLVASIDALRSRPVPAKQLGELASDASRWLFTMDWREPAALSSHLSTPGASWAVLDGDRGCLAATLREHGLQVDAHANVRSLAASLSADVGASMAASPDDDAAGPTSLGEDSGLPKVALASCLPRSVEDRGKDRRETPPGGSLTACVYEQVNAVLGLLQAWLNEQHLSRSCVAFVTQGAIAALPADGAPDMAGAAAWGLVRCAQLENPGRVLLIDLDGEAGSWKALPAAVESALVLDEPQLAIRDGRILIPRLARADANSAADRPTGESAQPNRVSDKGDDVAGTSVTTGGVGMAAEWLDGEGTVLITGGTGGLGAQLARHLVSGRGVRHLVLASRRGEDAEGAADLEVELSALGANVRIMACDVSNRGELETLISSVSAEHPLRGVVHAAGVLDDGVIGSLTAERVNRVLAAKADGAWHLHQLTRDLDLRAFVMFSSLAGTLGSPGQGNYAAANAFLDALALRRRSEGLPAVSLVWGPWARDAGMTRRLGEVDLARVARAGVRPLSIEEGLELFDRASARDEALLIAMRLARSSLRAGVSAGMLPPPLRDLAGPVVRRPDDVSSGSLVRRLESAPEHEREQLVLQAVRNQVAAVLGHASANAIEPSSTFKKLGFDSLAAVELRNGLSVASDQRLPATLVFDYPTPAALAHALVAEMSLDQASDRSLEFELDRLERLLTAVPAEDARRATAVARLQTLLRRLNDSDGVVNGVVSTEEALQTASPDELYDFIDRQLGSA